jgi:NADH:ubiquinone oxidoreductase subunit E
VDKLKRTLKLEAGETDADARFTLEVTRCVGCCGLAPVITVNDDVYGKVTPDDIDGILKNYN